MTNVITCRENLIFSFPEELDTAEWLELTRLLPPDYFLYGILTWVFTGEQEVLNEVIETLEDSYEWVPDPKKSLDDVNALFHRQAGMFYQSFMALLQDLIPEHLPSGIELQHVIYDTNSHDIYIIFDPDAEAVVNINDFAGDEMAEEISDAIIIDEDDEDEPEDEDNETPSADAEDLD
jgi:hypothetical protein